MAGRSEDVSGRERAIYPQSAVLLTLCNTFAKLAFYRRPTRQSARTVEYGQRLLETGYIKRLGDDVLWSALEQIALAALDVGDWELVEVSESTLSRQKLSLTFDHYHPGRPSVAALLSATRYTVSKIKPGCRASRHAVRGSRRADSSVTLLRGAHGQDGRG